MQKKWQYFILIMASIFAWFTFTKPAQAAISGAAGFSVEPVDNEIGNQADYFSLNLQPGQSHPLKLKLTNNYNKAIKIVIIPTVAGTDNSGQINYANVTKKRDSSLKYDWTKMGPTKQTVKLQPKQSQVVNQNLQIPQGKFNGVMLGSFYVYSPTVNKNLKKDNAKKNRKVAITNLYSYSVGILMNVGDISQAQPNLRLYNIRLGLLKVDPAVFLNLQNFQPKYIKDGKMQVHARIYRRHSNELVVQNKKKQMSFAPNSNFDFPVSWGTKRMQAGNYQARVRVRTPERSWYFVKNFTISPKDANRLNRQNPDYHKNYWPLILIIVIIILLLIGLLFYWFYKRGQNQIQNKQ